MAEQFKIGNKVEILDNMYGYPTGTIGEIIEMSPCTTCDRVINHPCRSTKTIRLKNGELCKGNCFGRAYNNEYCLKKVNVTLMDLKI